MPAALGKGMRERELRAAVKCGACGKPFGHTRSPLFWRLTIARYGVRTDALQRQDGLAAMVGSPVLAAILGPDEEMAQLVMKPVTVTICEGCALSPQVLAIIAEGASRAANQEEGT